MTNMCLKVDDLYFKFDYREREREYRTYGYNEYIKTLMTSLINSLCAKIGFQGN